MKEKPPAMAPNDPGADPEKPAPPPTREDALAIVKQLSPADRLWIKRTLEMDDDTAALLARMQGFDRQLDGLARSRAAREERPGRRNQSLDQLILQRRLPTETGADWEQIRKALLESPAWHLAFPSDIDIPDAVRADPFNRIHDAWKDENAVQARSLQLNYEAWKRNQPLDPVA